MAINVNAEIRNVAGKGAARAIRNNKNIPAVKAGRKCHSSVLFRSIASLSSFINGSLGSKSME